MSLNADRHAMQRPAQPARHRFGFGRLRSLHGGLAIETMTALSCGSSAACDRAELFMSSTGGQFLFGDRVRPRRHQPVQFGTGPSS